MDVNICFGVHGMCRPLIDFDMVLMMEPLTIAGAILGSYANKCVHPALLTHSHIVSTKKYEAHSTEFTECYLHLRSYSH
jgi:hypothetical protein